MLRTKQNEFPYGVCDQCGFEFDCWLSNEYDFQCCPGCGKELYAEEDEGYTPHPDNKHERDKNLMRIQEIFNGRSGGMRIGTTIDYPQAFPIATATDVTLGMSLRDYFAGQALNKIALPTFPIHDRCKGLPEGGNGRECIAWDAKVCYAYADAMLAEREKETSRK